jgi:thiosulfate reductase cytochrome b subunit
MSQGTVRTIFRWVHIVFAIPILGYIYDSPSDTHNYAFSVRYVFLPIILLSGLWMWKGHVVRRLFSERSDYAPNQVRRGRADATLG